MTAFWSVWWRGATRIHAAEREESRITVCGRDFIIAAWKPMHPALPNCQQCLSLFQKESQLNKRAARFRKAIAEEMTRRDAKAKRAKAPPPAQRGDSKPAAEQI